ncbi:hypothetical protein D3C75_185190 [compost metagenome]
MFLVIIWVFFCVLVGILASRFNRSGVGYFVLSVFISPVLSALLVLCLGKNNP